MIPRAGSEGLCRGRRRRLRARPFPFRSAAATSASRTRPGLPGRRRSSDPASALAKVPPGHGLLNIEATLATTDPSATPELRSLTLRYQTANLPPEIARRGRARHVQFLDDGLRPAEARLTLRWEATDPNGDDLSYTLHIRKDTAGPTGSSWAKNL